MASIPDQQPAPNSTPPRSRPGRGRGGGNQHDRSHDKRDNQTERGGRGGRTGSRGRATRGRGQPSAGQPSSTQPPQESVPASRRTLGVPSDQPVAGTGSKSESTEQRPNEAEEEVEAEVCFICASPVLHNAVAPCNHRTCHICSLRLRALYKTKTCAHCRTPSDFVIFTDDAVKRFEDYSRSDFFRVDNTLGIQYATSDVFEDTILLLRYNCPDEDCDVACLSWPDLHRHVKSTHGTVMCDLCTRNKKVFTHEHELLTPSDLRKHEKFGDDNPGAIDQTGFKGHPECGFCRRRFYGDDELYTHCREKHERCHICDRRNQGAKPVYYLNYDTLEDHFRKDHFLCADKECLERKFVVFESEMDMQGHQLESHPNGLTRDARRVNMSSFSFRDAYVPPRRGGEQQERQDRGGRGRGRGRDPNAERIPSSTAQPLRRDELAFQRQMAIHTAQSVAPRTFGGQLTAPPNEGNATAGQAPRASGRSQPAQTTEAPSLAPPNAATGRSRSPSGEVSPAEQARRLRHSAVVERAKGMLGSDPKKMDEFRSIVSSFKNSVISGSELIEAFFTLFDTTSAEVGTLVKELADIFEIPSRRDDLLKAWNDWKAVHEDYPSLPGSSTASISSTGTHGGKRVLKLKSSTAQSSRSAVSRTGSWGSTNVNSLFPPLSSIMATAGRASPGRTSTPWAAPSAAPASHQGSSRSSAPRSTGISNVSNAEAFPALPTAAKPTSTYFSPGYTGFGVRRDHSSSIPASNAWSGGATAERSDGATSAAQGGVDGDGIATGKKKANKNKKQTLIHFG